MGKTVTQQKSESRSFMSDSLWPHKLYSPWNCPGQDTGVGNHSLLQGIFPTQGLNPDLPHCRQTLYWLSNQGSLWKWKKQIDLVRWKWQSDQIYFIFVFFNQRIMVLQCCSVLCHTSSWSSIYYICVSPPSEVPPPNSMHLGGHSGEGNGTPLQYSCLENPMDGGAW